MTNSARKDGSYKDSALQQNTWPQNSKGLTLVRLDEVSRFGNELLLERQDISKTQLPAALRQRQPFQAACFRQGSFKQLGRVKVRLKENVNKPVRGVQRDV